jgi:aminoglycoside phosphotransferase (APT) family kinase protein
VRAPEVLAVGEDPGIIGAPFFLMEAVEGDVITSTVPAALDTPAERRRIGLELVDALADLHAVDWRAAGLEGFGKPTGYTERQLRRFLGLWEHNRTREIGEVERVAGWLRDNLPESGPATIVHGDFRLGNVMYAPGAPARLATILDWEMSTIGDPLADVGYLCMMWSEESDPPGGMSDLHTVTRAEGFPTRAELVARYEERSGRTMRDIRWYTVLALWKSVVFMEGNFKRASSGLSDDPFLKTFGDGSCSSPAARRRWRVAARRGLLIDWGGVLTSNVFESFAAFCTAEGLQEDAVKDAFSAIPPLARCSPTSSAGAWATPTSSGASRALLEVGEPAG